MADPKVRFRHKDGSNYPSWKEIMLGDIATRVTRKNSQNETDRPLTIASIEGLVDQRTYFSKTIASKDMSGYFLLKRGEFAYNKSYSAGYDYGSIKRLDKYDMGALSTLYICFALNEGENSDFYDCYFNGLRWYNQMPEICAEGARNHGLLNVSPNDFFKIRLSVPVSREEQQKIVDCFSAIDGVISASNEEVQNLEAQKKAAMKKIFSQEVRFKNYDGTGFPKWKESTIGAECEFINGKAHEKCEDDQGEYTIINSKYISTGGAIERRTNMLLEPLFVGDIVMVMSDVPNGKAMSKCMVIDKDNKFTLNQRICALRTQNNSIFFSSQISRCDYFMAFDDGIKQTNLRKQDILKCPVFVPCHDEQHLIADFLSDFDEAIAAAKRELELWRELKKGLLQQMFV